MPQLFGHYIIKFTLCISIRGAHFILVGKPKFSNDAHDVTYIPMISENVIL
jgi:hypothetical protein